MAEFQTVMKQWARMCNAVPGKKEHANLCSDRKSGYICPLVDCGLCCKPVLEQTDDDRLNGEKIIMSWAEENPEPVYPTWGEWLVDQAVMVVGERGCYGNILPTNKIFTPIPADIAEKLGIEPKEG